MLTKRVLFGSLVALIFLCLFEAVLIVGLKTPETRFIVKTVNQPIATKPEAAPSTNVNQAVNAAPPAGEPAWRTQNLYFLDPKDDVKIIETGVKGQSFVLRSPGPTGFGSYNLWFVTANGRPRLLSGEAMTECDSIDIGKADDYVYADYRTSPCEAGSSHAVSYYRPDGNLAFTLRYGTGDAAGSLRMAYVSGNKTRNIEIAPVWSGSCKVASERMEDENSAPTIIFTGVTASLDGGKKTFYAIEKKQDRLCEMQYGGGFGFPGITGASLSGGKIRMATSFGVTVMLDLADASKPPSFEVTETTKVPQRP